MDYWLRGHDGDKNPYAEEVCFGVNYIRQLLFKGYKFHPPKNDRDVSLRLFL